MKYEFPDGFLWGASTSAHQVEGNSLMALKNLHEKDGAIIEFGGEAEKINVRNDWTEWEKENAGRLAREAKQKFGYLENWNDIEGEATDPQNYISGIAAGHYNRFREDFDLAKNLGHNAHRFSIEWARIEPEKGRFDGKQIEHYRQVLTALRERGIEPFVTLWHWTNPLWVSEAGGWENPETVESFSKYADYVAKELGGLIKFWVPLNEPGTYIGMGYIQGAFPPGKRLNLFAANRVFKNLMGAYRQTYLIIHERNPEALVGISHYAVFMSPYKNRFYNKLLVKALDYVRNWRFIDSAKGANDFIGIQYYHTDSIRWSPLFDSKWGIVDARNSNSWTTDMGWDVYPEGLYHLIKRAQKYGKPVYITENGIADKKDLQRERFIKENLKQTARAISEGADVRGYFYWSLMDNFEWDKGFWPRFGLIGIDYKTLERTPRPSAYSYKKIIEDNGIIE
ncbi:MAG: glycoside hydrolase family 1 protein [Candidatus Paceibacterota bacterium]|jgi:beta-glucosidase